MTIGKSLLRLRMEQGMTQGEVGARAGLATSYISRIENDRIQPTMGTLNRITDALEIPVSRVFGGDDGKSDCGHRCPVSTSGACIGELLRSARGKKPKSRKDAYTMEEVRLLRMADYLVMHGSKEVRQSLEVLLESLLLRSGKKSRGGKKLFAE